MSAAISDSSHPPNFLGIGMQKTGTTWLYEHLRRHPEVYLTPRKELRHLMEIAKAEVSGAPCEIPLFQRMRRGYDRGFLARNAKKFATGTLTRADWLWDWRHLTARHCDARWYTQQFAHIDAPVRGEISPQYHQLDEAEVEAVARIFPDLRVVLLLRQPVDQIWSQARMVLAREEGRAADQVDRAAYEVFFDRWRKINFDYTAIIDCWSAAFGEANLFVGFYDELAADPAALFARICEFLEIERRVDAALERPVNRGQDAPIPEALRAKLEAQWSGCIEGIVARYPALDHWRVD